MGHLRRALTLLVSIAAVMAGVCVIVMIVHVSADILMRLFTGRSIIGTIAFVMHYYMVIIVCLPLAFVERFNQHIAVDVVTDLLPASFRHHLRGWTYLFTASVYAVLTYATWIEAMQRYYRGAFVVEHDLLLPIWHGYFSLPVGCGLLTIYLIFKFFAYLAGAEIDPPSDNTQDDGELTHG